MTEQQTTEQAPDESTPVQEAPADAEDSTGTAVYDQTLGRFVGGVHRGTGAAKAAKALIDSRDDGHTYTTVKV